MTRKNGRHFCFWEPRVDGVLYKIEVRCIGAENDIEFFCRLPDSETYLKDVNPNLLRQAVDKQLRQEKGLQWETMLVVEGGNHCNWGSIDEAESPEELTDIPDGEEVDVNLELHWVKVQRALGPNNKWLWRSDAKSRVDNCMPLDTRKSALLPWTAEREAALLHMSNAMRNLGRRLHAFLRQPELPALLSLAGVQRLLPAAETTNKKESCG